MLHVRIISMVEHVPGFLSQLGLPFLTHTVDTGGPAPQKKHRAGDQQEVPCILPPPAQTHFSPVVVRSIQRCTLVVILSKNDEINGWCVLQVRQTTTIHSAHCASSVTASRLIHSVSWPHGLLVTTLTRGPW